MDDLLGRAQKIVEKVNLDDKKREARELETQAEKPEFWQDHQRAARKMQKLALIQEEIIKLEKIEDWLRAEKTSSDNQSMERIVNDLEAKLYLSGPYDVLDAIVSIHSGQGGVEAMDWAGMLYRLYLRCAASKDWETKEIDYQPGEEAGIKEVVFQVKGDSAYGLLKYEAGVHRLVRQSPFNADQLRQTSFALVEVIPALTTADKSDLTIRDEDLQWEFFRSGGKGGQNVNKVSTAVRVKHKPTGLVITCQKERSQEQNRQLAIRILQGKLLQLEEEKRKEEELKLRGKHITAGWGNQIRSYVLHPYHLVKDLRTGYEERDTEAVLDGKIDKFLEAELNYFS